ncbi:MAG: hypothetical protein ACOCTG_00250 [Bacteroidota bacterium]
MPTITTKEDMIQWIEDALDSEGSREMAVQLTEELWPEAHEERQAGESLEDYMERVDIVQRASDWIEQQDREYRESLREGARMQRDGE